MKFARLSPEDRRLGILNATLALLARAGSAGLSIRKISAEAGISVGLITHHFGSRDELIAQSYQLASTRQMQAFEARRAAPDQPATDAAFDFIDCYLAPEIFDPASLRLWLVFWDMYSRTPRMRDVHRQSFGAYRLALEGLLAPEFPAPDQQRKIALGALTMMDGLWLEAALNPGSVTRAEAVALAQDWLRLHRKAQA